MQELERIDSGLRSLASVQGALAMYAIHTYGDEAQKQRWLPELAAARAIAPFALTERLHGSDPGGMETTARRVGDEYILNGNKCWIGNGSIPDVRVVWAKNDDGKVEGFLVERDAPGLRAQDIEGKLSLKLSRTAELWFEDCRIPAANRLPGAKGLKAALGCLGEARFGIAWGVIGAAQDCYQSALDYTFVWRRCRDGFRSARCSRYTWLGAKIAALYRRCRCRWPSGTTAAQPSTWRAMRAICWVAQASPPTMRRSVTP